MMRPFSRVVAVVVVGALAGACGGGNRSGEPAVLPDDPPAAPASFPEASTADPVEGSGPVSAASVPVADPPAVEAAAVEAFLADSDEGAEKVPGLSGGLLSEPIPPCTPLGGVDHDPCSPLLPPTINPGGSTASIPSWVKDPPSFDLIMSGMGLAGDTPHIVVRVTVQPGTTCCEGYATRDFSYLGGSTSDITNYWCFSDVRVNEYIVGAGPTTLTIGLLRHTFLPAGDRDWEEDKDWAIEREFKNPATRVAATYEERELVLFLKPPVTMAVESWTVFGSWDTWFVRRDPDTDPPTVTALFRWEHSVVSEVALDDLVTEVRAAAAARTTAAQAGTAPSSSTTTDQPTTTIPPWAGSPPYLVTRADQLRAFYIAAGATYEGEDATTVLPPPPPIPPGVPTNVGLSVVDGRTLIVWDEPESGGEADEYRVSFTWEISDGHTGSFYNEKAWRGELFFEITYMMSEFSSEFSVEVRAGNTHGYSPWTEAQTFTTPTTTTTATPTTTTTATPTTTTTATTTTTSAS